MEDDRRADDGEIIKDRLKRLQADMMVAQPGHEAAAFLAAIVESSDDAIISKSLKGIITTWNLSAERLFGYTADEAIGQPITILIPEDRLGEEPAILTRINAGERVDHFETIRRRKDGTLIDISLTISPIRAATARSSALPRSPAISRNGNVRQSIRICCFGRCIIASKTFLRLPAAS